jgi:1-deoxy-D-xylulose-5-phosphate synthase
VGNKGGNVRALLAPLVHWLPGEQLLALCAPLDASMIADAARHGAVLTCEDGIRDGGIGMTIADQVHELSPTLAVVSLGVPTMFIPQAKPDRILASFGLDADGILASAQSLLA